MYSTNYCQKKDFKESDLYPILIDHTLKNSFNCTEKGTLINLVSCHKSIKIKYFYINGKYPIEILPDDDLVQYFGFKKKLGIGKKDNKLLHILIQEKEEGGDEIVDISKNNSLSFGEDKLSVIISNPDEHNLNIIYEKNRIIEDQNKIIKQQNLNYNILSDIIDSNMKKKMK